MRGDAPAMAGLPVLKNLVDRLLRQRADVLAFHSAPPAQGGTGAVLVLLAPPSGAEQALSFVVLLGDQVLARRMTQTIVDATTACIGSTAPCRPRRRP